MNIQQLQDKLLAYYAQNCLGEREIYDVLGFAKWDDYHAVYDQIWTPQFRYRLYILHNPHSTIEQTFLKAWGSGCLEGFDLGYNAALDDIQNGIAL